MNEETGDDIPMQEASQQIQDRASLLNEIGNELKKARESRGESVEDVVRILKLRKVYIEALETGDWSRLPDEVYVIAFLKQYASHLHLDISNYLEKLKQDEFRLTRPLTFPDPAIAPSRRWSLIFAILFLVLIIAFNLYEKNDTVEMDTTPSQPISQPSETQRTEAEKMVATPPAREEYTPPSDMESEPGTSRQFSGSEATQTPEDSIHPESGERSATEVPIHRHVYRFMAVDEPVWLQVYLPTSEAGQWKLEREVLLQPGQSLKIVSQTGTLRFTTGNAGALKIAVDGQILFEAGSLGDSGQVIRDRVIDITR